MRFPQSDYGAQADICNQDSTQYRLLSPQSIAVALPGHAIKSCNLAAPWTAGA